MEHPHRRNDALNDARAKLDLWQGRHCEIALPVAGGKTLCHSIIAKFGLVNRNATKRCHNLKLPSRSLSAAARNGPWERGEGGCISTVGLHHNLRRQQHLPYKP